MGELQNFILENQKALAELKKLRGETAQLCILIRRAGLPVDDIPKAIKQVKRMIRLIQKVRKDLIKGDIHKARRRINYFKKRWIKEEGFR